MTTSRTVAHDVWESETRIVFRVPGCMSFVHNFDSDALFQEAYDFITQRVEEFAKFELRHMSHPEFKGEDMQQSFRALQLASSAVIFIVPHLDYGYEWILDELDQGQIDLDDLEERLVSLDFDQSHVICNLDVRRQCSIQHDAHFLTQYFLKHWEKLMFHPDIAYRSKGVDTSARWMNDVLLDLKRGHISCERIESFIADFDHVMRYESLMMDVKKYELGLTGALKMVYLVGFQIYYTVRYTNYKFVEAALSLHVPHERNDAVKRAVYKYILNLYGNRDGMLKTRIIQCSNFVVHLLIEDQQIENDLRDKNSKESREALDLIQRRRRAISWGCDIFARILQDTSGLFVKLVTPINAYLASSKAIWQKIGLKLRTVKERRYETVLLRSLVSRAMVVVLSCPVQGCRKQFTRQGLLDRHANRVHTEKLFSCVCEKQFSSAGGLARHQGSAHTNNPTACLLCPNRYFTTQEGLKGHMRAAHEGIVFECPFEACKRQFRTKSNQKRHISTVHLAEKPYACSDCGLLLPRSDSMALHMQIHDKVRMFQCCICEVRFRSNFNMKRHIAGVHGMTP